MCEWILPGSVSLLVVKQWDLVIKNIQFLSCFIKKSQNSVDYTFQRWMILCARDVRATVRSLCLCDTLQQRIRLECRLMYPYNMLLKHASSRSISSSSNNLSCFVERFRSIHVCIICHLFGNGTWFLILWRPLQDQRLFDVSWKRHGRALKSTSP